MSGCFLLQVSRCRTFDTVTRLQADEPRFRGFIPDIRKRFFILKNLYWLWVIPASHAVCTAGSFFGFKVAGTWSDHSPLSQPKLRMCGAHFSTFPHGELLN